MKLRRHLSYANVVSSLTVFLALAGGTAFGATHLPAKAKPPKHKVPKPKPPVVATEVGKDKVTSASVVDNSLTSADLADGTGVTGADVADGALSSNDFPAGSLNGSKLANGSVSGSGFQDGSLDATKLAKGSVGASTLGPKSVNSAAIADGIIKGTEILRDTIKGRSIKVPTLQGVPNAERLDGRLPSEFLNATIDNRFVSPDTGVPAGEGTFRRSVSCQAGDLLIGGGVFGLDAKTSLVENFPKEGAWTVRVNPHGEVDDFQIQVLCVKQQELR
jgi:hypothetical protein